MKRTAVLFDEGFEEIEALAPVDLLRRAGIQVDLIGASNQTEVTGRSGVTIKGTIPMKDYDFSQIDSLMLPGGGHYVKLEANPKVKEEILKAYNNPDVILAAICASPTILGRMGLLKDKNYTCFLSMNEDFGGTLHPDQYAVTDGKIITGKSAAAGIDFGMAIIKALLGEDREQEIKESIYY